MFFGPITVFDPKIRKVVGYAEQCEGVAAFMWLEPLLKSLQSLRTLWHHAFSSEWYLAAVVTVFIACVFVKISRRYEGYVEVSEAKRESNCAKAQKRDIRRCLQRYPHWLPRHTNRLHPCISPVVKSQ